MSSPRFSISLSFPRPFRRLTTSRHGRETCQDGPFFRIFLGTPTAGCWNSAMDVAASSTGKGGISLREQESTEAFVRLLIRHQDDLFRYIYSLLPHYDDA